LAVFRGGISLLEQGRSDFLYLTTTDYMQHKFAPDRPELIAFYAEIDKYLGRLLELGARIAITADHGMNAKNRPNGQPKVIYLETILNETLDWDFRVVCPITDPYVVHHGALGAFVCVHGAPDAPFDRAREVASALDGVTEVYYREEAAKRLELPPDRIGDLVVLCGRDSVLGRRREDHDLSLLEGGLRSHGGRYEEMVPLLVSVPLNEEYRAIAEGDPRNWDVFAFASNSGQQ
jgi:phosphonoacetate hydrolase